MLIYEKYDIETHVYKISFHRINSVRQSLQNKQCQFKRVKTDKGKIFYSLFIKDLLK